MHNYKSKSKTLASLLIMSTFAISCTKEVPYKNVYKGDGPDKVQEKSIIDTSAEYLYVVSSDLTNHDSTGASNALPYWQGEEKIVKFKFTKDTLQVLQTNEEQRLRDNKTNEKIILEIPVSHVDYQCAIDRYDKCTNQEIENREIDWSKKKKFVPNFSNMKSLGFNLIPMEMDKVFGSSCFTETGSQFLGYDITDKSLNIQVQKTFRGDLSCLEQKNVQIVSLNDLNTEIVYHYSFTKLASVASPTYKPVSYPVRDEGEFGFFTTDSRKYDVDYSRTEALKTQLMNRWNPAKKEIVYYLSDNFNKPEFKSVKEATYQAFERFNNGLAAGGLPNRLVLKEPDHKVPGDVRNSMIILVEDPIANGPLGYGPTVANPRTGEIMSGRVVMYHGNFLKGVRYTYDEVVRELRREKAEAKVKSNAQASSAAADKESAQNTSLSGETLYNTQLNNYMKSLVSQKLGKKIAADYSKSKVSARGSQVNRPDITQSSALGTSVRPNQNKYEYLVSDKKNTARDVISAMSKYCNYPSELFPFNEIIKNTLKNKMGNNLKLWNELTAKEKNVAISVLMPEMWLPTLVHELGHNLGLRHNFGASEDKDNFYSKDELFKMGVQHEIPYSSVMDYGYSELNLLPTLGKYDIAALRFGYNREVETTEGKILKIDTTIQNLKKQLEAKNEVLSLKNYQYCSDEHVEVNPNCKRFDKGTTFPEIVDHLIQSYEDMYVRRNFRNGRESFSKANDGGYYLFTWGQFMYIRAFMERYESIKAKYHMADDDEEWTTNNYLKNIKSAAIKSGQFFLNVLKMPDLICVTAKTADPEKTMQYTSIHAFEGAPLSCFDIELKDEYVMVGQLGKLFNDRKDPNSDNHYSDQIDVRGIWPDKLAAVRALLYRKTGNFLFDEYEDNYADIPELQQPLAQTLSAMLFNQVQTPARLIDKEGNVVKTIPFRVRTFDGPSAFKTTVPMHWINTVYDENVANTVGLPLQLVSIQQMIFQTIAESTKTSQSHRPESQSFLNSFGVTKVLSAASVQYRDDVSVKEIGDSRYIAFPENSIANDLIILGNFSGAISKLSEAELDQLIQEKEALQQAAKDQQASGPPAPPAPAAQSKFSPEYLKIPLGILQAYKKGNLEQEEDYNYLLSLLPVMNQK